MTKHEPPEMRRRQFLDATGRVFLREGLAGVTMIAVAKEAGLSRRLLYDFFPDLRTLLRDYFLDALSRRLTLVVGDGGVERSQSETPVDGLRTVMRAVLAFDEEQRMILELLRGRSQSAELALVADVVRRNMIERWRSYPQLAELPEDRVVVVATMMLSVVLDLSSAVGSGAIHSTEAEEIAVTLGTAAVASLARR